MSRAPDSAQADSGRGALRSAPARRSYNGAVRGRVADLQRARILSGMFDVAAERGGANVTVAHVVERSGVSRRTFYEMFNDREDCFIAAFDQALDYASERVLPAYEAAGSWREKIRAGLVALLSFLDDEPLLGRLLVVDSHAGGAAIAKRRNAVIAALIGAVDQGRAEGKVGLTPTTLTAEGVVGGVLTVIHSRLADRRHEPLIELVNQLTSMIMLPYMGAAAARRELERSVTRPPTMGHAEPHPPDPFKEAGMRLTYRTVRVLMAIAEHPEASNSLIASRAEIKDQGQISKLLTRLQRAAMIANTGVTSGKGAPNSWALTSSGRQVVATIRSHREGRKQRGDGR